MHVRELDEVVGTDVHGAPAEPADPCAQEVCVSGSGSPGRPRDAVHLPIRASADLHRAPLGAVRPDLRAVGPMVHMGKIVILRTWEMVLMAVISMGSFEAALVFWNRSQRWRDRYEAECRAHDETRGDRDRVQARLDRITRRWRLSPVPRIDAGDVGMN